MKLPTAAALLVGTILLMSARSGQCEICEVPSATYPTLESAIEVINCTEIVLAAGWYFGDVLVGRSLELRGPLSDTTTIVGQVVVQGDLTTASLAGLTIAGPLASFPYGMLVVEGNADVVTDDVVIGSTDIIFRDGFERGNTSSW
jgi:hypothetical protein